VAVQQLTSRIRSLREKGGKGEIRRKDLVKSERAKITAKSRRKNMFEIKGREKMDRSEKAEWGGSAKKVRGGGGREKSQRSALRAKRHGSAVILLKRKGRDLQKKEGVKEERRKTGAIPARAWEIPRQGKRQGRVSLSTNSSTSSRTPCSLDLERGVRPAETGAEYVCKCELNSGEGKGGASLTLLTKTHAARLQTGELR